MINRGTKQKRRGHSSRGLSLVEVMAVITIMSVLVILAEPLGSVIFVREKEILLLQTLRRIRKAIDQYHERDSNADGTPDYIWPRSWVDLYDSGFIKSSMTVNPISGEVEDWAVILSLPDSGSTAMNLINAGNARYPHDPIFHISPRDWHVMLDSFSYPDQLPNRQPWNGANFGQFYGDGVGIWDIRYPEARIGLDERSTYDMW
ncbi:MAG: type II secretion system protein [bacterium]|jgi:prepilin-type N-terminal cleavage/methylation domain-containing protein|nr:type II secretion system protein [bacterium]